MTNTTKIILGVVLLILLGGLTYTYLKAPTTDSSTRSASSMPAVTAEDWKVEAPGSQVTLVEYADYQCPACAAYYPLIETLKHDYKDKVTFVFRLFPLPMHTNAVPAGIAAEAAGLQGKYFEMGDKLFTNQKTWEESTAPNDIFIGYAKDLGLDVEKFKTDIASDALKQKVVASFKGGTVAKVNSTPTFFINGVKIKNPTGNTNDEVLKGFHALLDAELAKAVPVQTSTTTAVSATSTN